MKIKLTLFIIYLNSLEAAILGADNLRDVRELFAGDTEGGAAAKSNFFERDDSKDPIRGMQSFVKKVVNSSSATYNTENLEKIIEDGFGNEYPNFAIDVDILTKDHDQTKNSMDVSFNIRYQKK